MQQLKKIAAIGGAISLALCWPLAVGHIGEKVMTDAVSTIQNDVVETSIKKYDRSYLSSTVTTHYTLTDPSLIAQFEADGLPKEFDVVSEISHGVIHLTAESKVVGLHDVPLTLTTVTQLNGNTEFELNLDAWNFSQPNGEGAFSISPSHIVGSLTVLGELDYQLSVPSAQVSLQNGESLHLTQLTGQGKGKKEQGYWLGEQSIGFEVMELDSPNQNEKTELKNVSYQFSSEKNQEATRLSNHHLFNMGELFVDGMYINDMLIDFSLLNIDTESFEFLMEAYQGDPTLEEDTDVMMSHVDTLFSKGFDIELNKFSVSVGEGDMTSKWSLSVPEGTQGVSQGPHMLLSELIGNTTTFVSNGLVEEYPSIQQNIDELMVMEMIEQSEQGYTFEASLSEGQVKLINGQELPLINLLFPLLLQP